MYTQFWIFFSYSGRFFWTSAEVWIWRAPPKVARDSPAVVEFTLTTTCILVSRVVKPSIHVASIYARALHLELEMSHRSRCGTLRVNIVKQRDTLFLIFLLFALCFFLFLLVSYSLFVPWNIRQYWAERVFLLLFIFSCTYMIFRLYWPPIWGCS